jgi:hypothetical protein
MNHPALVGPAQSPAPVQGKGNPPMSEPPAAVGQAKRLPVNGFRDFLTLSSEFFATFVHTTYSLSVLYPYLALEGVYLPLRYVLSNIPTLELPQ